MNAARKKAKYKRVYQSDGSWYWSEPVSGKWIRLCKITDSEELLVKRLGEEMEKRKRPEGTGDMRPLIEQFVREKKHLRKDPAWPKYGEYAANAFRHGNIASMTPAKVATWLDNKYAGKLSMQRVMRAFLSAFFQWAVRKGLVNSNPCHEVPLARPKPSKTYITDEHFAAIRTAMLSKTYTKKDGKVITQKVPTGPMMQCFIDLCYLTLQRSTEIRLLKWSDVDRAAGVIHFLPTKTEDSSGIAVDITITPEITAVLDRVTAIDGYTRIGVAPVIHAIDGSEYAPGAFRAAFDRAAERAELSELGYTVKMVRAKALTDAERAGYDIKALQAAAAHSSQSTTEIYFKQREVPVADVRLRIPGKAA